MPHGYPHSRPVRPRASIWVCEQAPVCLTEVVAEVERAGGLVTDLQQGERCSRCWILCVEGLAPNALRRCLDERFPASPPLIEVTGVDA